MFIGFWCCFFYEMDSLAFDCFVNGLFIFRSLYKKNLCIIDINHLSEIL